MVISRTSSRSVSFSVIARDKDAYQAVFKAAGGGFLSRGAKFSPLDVKRVYFGNWLRDYSQVCSWVYDPDYELMVGRGYRRSIQD